MALKIAGKSTIGCIDFTVGGIGHSRQLKEVNRVK